MKGLIKIKTDEAGKVIALTATVPSNIIVCNIEDTNTDPATFSYNAETGELTILSRCIVEITGTLHLITDTELEAGLTIDLNKNGVQLQTLYTGYNNQRTFASFLLGLDRDDVLEFTVTCAETVNIETDTPQSYITVKRIY